MTDPKETQRIGIFGGSFDPIHQGHLIVAESFRESMSLDSVVFLPAYVSPFKTETIPTSDKHRVEMLRLAIGGNGSFRLDDREIKRGGISYTVDSLRAMHEERPGTEFFMLVGSDSLVGFDRWREPEAVLSLAQLVVAHRGGWGGGIAWEDLARVASPGQLTAVQSRILDVPQIEIASRDLRRRVREGRTIRYLVPAAVEAYIREHCLWV
jgi:nicotinate-nucleotide adenylyltransferase